MARMIVKFSALALIAVGLSACETVEGAATSTSAAMNSWYQSAKGAFASSDRPDATERNYFARAVGDDLATADAVAIGREGARALDQASAGTAVEWRNPETGVQAVLIPSDPVLEERKMFASLKKGVAQPSDLEIIGGTYQSRQNANLRGAPGIENPVVGRLAAGEGFTAVGRSRSLAWILVAQGGYVVGYVYEPLVAPAAAGGPAPQLREARMPRPGNDERPALDTILAATPCRNLAYDVVTGTGQRARAELRACKASDGAWEIN